MKKFFIVLFWVCVVYFIVGFSGLALWGFMTVINHISIYLDMPNYITATIILSIGAGIGVLSLIFSKKGK